MILYLTLLSYFSIANGLQCYNCVWLDNLEKWDPGFSPGDVNLTEKCLRPDKTLLETCPVYNPGNTEPEACLNMTYFLRPKPNTRFEMDFNLYFRFCNSTSVFTKIEQFRTTRQRQPFCARFGLAEVMGDEYNADSVMYNFERDSVIEFCSCTSDGCNAGVISEDNGGNGDGDGGGGGSGSLKSNCFFYLSFIAFALYKNVK